MYIDIAGGQADWREIYKLCIGFVNPRPIALVSTLSPDERPNLAPFSFYNMCSGNPPVVMFCPALRRDRSRKDTLQNVETRGEFVIATVSRGIVRQMVACGADLPYGASEFEFSGLTPRPASRVRPPLVGEAPVNIECVLRQIVYTGREPGSSAVVFGQIVALHLADELLDANGAVDPRKLTTVGRLGGAWYADASDPYELKIPAAPGG